MFCGITEIIWLEMMDKKGIIKNKNKKQTKEREWYSKYREKRKIEVKA